MPATSRDHAGLLPECRGGGARAAGRSGRAAAGPAGAGGPVKAGGSVAASVPPEASGPLGASAPPEASGSIAVSRAASPAKATTPRPAARRHGPARTGTTASPAKGLGPRPAGAVSRCPEAGRLPALSPLPPGEGPGARDRGRGISSRWADGRPALDPCPLLAGRRACPPIRREVAPLATCRAPSDLDAIHSSVPRPSSFHPRPESPAPTESLAKGRGEAQVWITRMEIARNRHLRVKLRRSRPMAGRHRAVAVTRGERRVHHVEAEDEGG